MPHKSLLFDHEWGEKKFPTNAKNAGSRNTKQDK